jgi:heme o synthase
LFLVIFVWTPPHFWALAVKYRKDYGAANVPMLPVVGTLKNTANQIVIYSLIMVALTLGFAPVAKMGVFYVASAAVLGAVFLFYAVKVYQTGAGAAPGAMVTDASEKPAMRLFVWSILYLTLLFIAIAVDQLIVHGF